MNCHIFSFFAVLKTVSHKSVSMPTNGTGAVEEIIKPH